MSVNELRALTQQFADAFDQRDLKPAIEMLAEDVEVFEYVPYRFDGKPMVAKHVNEAYEGIVSASFGFRQPSFRVYGDTVGIVNAYGSFRGVTRRQGPGTLRPRYLGLRQTRRAVEDRERPLLCDASGSLRIRPEDRLGRAPHLPPDAI